MARLKEPKVKADWPPKREKDSNYRYPQVYPVGRNKHETLSKIAKAFALSGTDLLKYNFHTTHEYEVNWYLVNYVKCPKPRETQLYVALAGTKYEEGGTSGAIYIPRWGEPVTDPTNRLGEQVVKNYNAEQVKKPGGACYDACYDRVAAAVRKVGGAALPANNSTNEFACLFGSHIEWPVLWAKLDEDLRGKGAAGAMVHQGLGTLVDSDGIWRGDLLPGAVIQVWTTNDGYERVKAGKKAGEDGHSFIFLNYVREGGSITGMAVADQSYYNINEAAKRSDWGYWVGANLTLDLGE